MSIEHLGLRPAFDGTSLGVRSNSGVTIKVLRAESAVGLVNLVQRRTRVGCCGRGDGCIACSNQRLAGGRKRFY